jgi:uncharacterized protein
MSLKILPLLIWLLFQTISDAAPYFVEINIGESVIMTEVVETATDQRRGLGYRDSLEQNKGMLFVYDKPGVRSFWMKGMRFAIDIIWIRLGKIVLIEKNVQPPPLLKKESSLKTYGRSVLADMVLEVSAGFSDQMKLTLGQQITINE